MKLESATDTRSDLARRITQRAKEMGRRAKIEIIPWGEPARALSTAEWIEFRDDEDALRIARRESVKAFRTRANHPNLFTPFPCKTESLNGVEISRKTIQRLIDKGLMAWVSPSVRSAAVLTDAGRMVDNSHG